MGRTLTEEASSKPTSGAPGPGRWPTLAAVTVVATGSVFLLVGLFLGGSGERRNAPEAGDASAEAACRGVSLTPQSALQGAFDTAPEGTTFCLAPGLYRLAEPLVPKSGSVIWGAPGTVLNGSRVLPDAHRSGEHWALTGELPPRERSGACEAESPGGCPARQTVFYDDRPLLQVASPGELGPGRFFVDPATNTIHVTEDPTGHKVEVAVSPGAIATASGDARRDNVTLRGLVVEKFAGSDAAPTAAITAGWNWSIVDSEIRFNGSVGVGIDTGGVLRHNRIHHNADYGFLGGPLRGLTVEGNDISFNGTSAIGADGGGGKVVRSADVVFRGNAVHENVGRGLRTENGNVNVTYEANSLERNAGPGISHDSSADAVIRNNVFRQNGLPLDGSSLYRVADLHVTNSENVEIAGNSIEAGVHGIGLYDFDRGASDQGVLAIRNVHVHDNIIRMRDGGFTGLVGSRSAAYTTANNRFERNKYYVTDLSVIFFMWRESCTWMEWQAKGHDVDGTIETWTPGLTEPAIAPPTGPAAAPQLPAAPPGPDAHTPHP